MNYLYTNGVIAVKERALLKEKILRLAELSEEEAFRMLFESGFGGGAEGDIEALIAREEEEIDSFILEYTPGRAETEYLLSPRDFHNTKALFKAEYLHSDAEKMLTSRGLVPIELISKACKERAPLLEGELQSALTEAFSLIEGEREPSGAEIGVLFERALYAHLARVCKRNKHLRRIIAAKADMWNILSALRSSTEEYAKKNYLKGGILPEEKLKGLFLAEEQARRALEDTPYSAFYRIAYEAKEKGKPYTEAERYLRSYERIYLSEHTDEEGNLKFLSYVLRRRTEAENVRTVFVCRSAGMSEQAIKSRLRG